MEQVVIIFGGHFTVGEHPIDLQRNSVELARSQPGDLGVVVNDIDLKRRLQFFRIGGKEMVIRHYGNRKKCGTTKTLCELPDFAQILQMIDWNFYEEAVKVLNESSEDIDTTIRTQIVPLSIERHLQFYNLLPENVRIFRERELRNYAAGRLSPTSQINSRSWYKQLEQVHLLKEVMAHTSAVPVCGALLLGLYEQLSNFGYQSVMQFYSEGDRGPIENGERIYFALHSAFPDDPRWQLNIQTTYIS